MHVPARFKGAAGFIDPGRASARCVVVALEDSPERLVFRAASRPSIRTIVGLLGSLTVFGLVLGGITTLMPVKPPAMQPVVSWMFPIASWVVGPIALMLIWNGQQSEAALGPFLVLDKLAGNVTLPRLGLIIPLERIHAVCMVSGAIHCRGSGHSIHVTELILQYLTDDDQEAASIITLNQPGRLHTPRLGRQLASALNVPFRC